MQQIRVVIYSKSEEEQRILRSFLENESIVCQDIIRDERDMLESITRCLADIIVVSVTAESMKSIFLNCQQIYLLRPTTTVVLVSKKMDMNLIQQANFAGIHNVIPFPESREECVSAVKNIYANESKRNAALLTGQEKPSECKLFMVYGSKGGVGKTTFALNTAVELARRGRKVIIVDLDLEFGDVASHMGIDERDTIAELFADNRELDMDIIRDYITIHPSGLHAVFAPKTPEYAELIKKEKVEALLAILMKNYDYIFVDTAPTFSDVNLAVIDIATNIFFIVGLDVAVLKNSRKGIKILQALGKDQKVMIVVSKDEKSAIKYDDIAGILGMNVWDSVAGDSKSATAALNQGITVSDLSSKSKLKNEFVRIAQRIDASGSGDLHSDKPKKRSLFSMLGGK